MPVKRKGPAIVKRLWASPRRWVYVSLLGLAGLAILGGLGGDSDYWTAAGGALAVLGYWVWVEMARQRTGVDRAREKTGILKGIPVFCKFGG